MLTRQTHSASRLSLWLAVGLLLGAVVFLGLFFLDPGTAGAQEDPPASTTTTTEPPATTTTTTTTTPVEPAPDVPTHSDPLGDPGSTALLARLLAFTLGVVVTR